MPTSTRLSSATTESAVGRSKVPRSVPVVAAIGVAWLLSASAYAAGAAWILPPLLLVGLMSVQSAGRTLLDRLVLAVAQLFGVFCAAGLVISIWPWHLHPVPIAGCAFTALVLFAVATGRRPRLPLRVPASDAVAWLAIVSVSVLATVPFAIRGVGDRLGIVATGEDFARHFMLYDVIGKVGGYAFLHRDAAAAFAPDTFGFGYPQGAHLLYAVLERFVRSSNVDADSPTAMDVLLWCHLGTYLFLATALLWAVRRVAGPGPGPAALLPVLGVTAGVLYFGDLITPFLRGYPNELLGLALVAILTALAARPPARPREQVVTVAALLVGLSFTYHLYLPYALAVSGVWAWRRRRALPKLLTVVVTILTVPLVLITPMENRPSGTGNLLLAAGTAIPVDRTVVLAVVLAALVGMVGRAGRRAPSRRTLATELGIALAMISALLAYQYATVGHSVYYFEKLLHMLLVVALVGLGSVARLLPRLFGRAWAICARARYAVALGVTFIVVAGLGSTGGRWHTRPLASPGLRYGLGLEKGSPAGARLALDLARRYPEANGAVDVVVASTPYANFFGTLFTAVMQHNYRQGEAWYLFLSPSGPAHTLADLDAKVEQSPVPVRFVVRDPEVRFLSADGDTPPLTNMQAARYLAARYPDKVKIIVAR